MKSLALRFAAIMVAGVIASFAVMSQTGSASLSDTMSIPPRKGIGLLDVQENGTPKASTVVTYGQTTHDFLFGVGTRATGGQLPLNFFEEFRRIGLNYLIPTTDWGWLEPSPGVFDWSYIDQLRPTWLQELGYVLHGHLLIFFNKGTPDLPNYLMGMSLDELSVAVYSHVLSVVKDYRGIIKYWTINEPDDPWSDYYHLSQSQWIKLVHTAGIAIRASDPEAKILINLVVNDHDGWTPHGFLDALVSEGIEFDAIGLEIYPGMVTSDPNGFPDLQASQMKIESFGRFGKPIIITEIATPDIASIDARVTWLRSFYAMVFATPPVAGIAWFYTVDDPGCPIGSMCYRSGLFPDAGSPPRPLYGALADIIAERTSRGTVTTDSYGCARIEGYAGDYSIKIDNFYPSFTVHIAEGQEHQATLGLTWFAHVVVGGGFSTNLTILNTGPTTATGNLVLTDQTGNPLSVSLAEVAILPQSPLAGDGTSAADFSFSVSVPPGATKTFTANALNLSDPTTSGWACVESSGGSLGGVTTIEYRQGGVLQTIAGVLSSQSVEFATIPVDNDDSQNRFTGFAVANPNNENINIKLVTLGEDGTVLDTINPTELNPIGPKKQLARFLTDSGYLPSRARFRGSMVLLAQGGKKFVITALAQNKGQYTAIPVISSKAPNVPN